MLAREEAKIYNQTPVSTRWIHHIWLGEREAKPSLRG